MLDAGITDILIAYPIVGDAKERLANIAEQAKITVALDWMKQHAGSRRSHATRLKDRRAGRVDVVSDAVGSAMKDLLAGTTSTHCPRLSLKA